MEKAEAGEGGDADSYQKLRQIYRDIQTGAKAFLTAEYGMCVKFIAVFGFAMIFFVANVTVAGTLRSARSPPFHSS